MQWVKNEKLSSAMWRDTATSKGFTGWDQYYKPLQYIIMENALTIQQIHTVICYKWNYLKKTTTIPSPKKMPN